MEINVVAGHGLSKAQGARGINGIKEEVLTRQFAKELYRQLQEKGYYTRYIAVDDPKDILHELETEVKLCNDTKADLNIFIHFNAFSKESANGAEILTWDGKEIHNADIMLDNLSKLGLRNRGLKEGNNLYVIKHTRTKSMLIEFCFITSEKDFNILRKVGSVKLCKAIADSLPLLQKNYCPTCGKEL